MSNQDDFWTTIAAGHTNTVLAGVLDEHLSPTDPALSVRHLTDKLRAENALPLPVKNGTRVCFAGGLGAHLTYESVPADGAFGEVVTVKSANGHITEHDGKVFVQWDDGKFRAIHAEHLRLAKRGKKASRVPRPGQEFTVSSHYTDIAGMGQYSSTMNLPFMVNEDGSASLMERGRPSTAPENMLSRKEVVELFRRGTGRGLNVNTHMTDPQIKKGSDLKADFEKIKALAKKKPDNEFLMSLLEQMANEGFAPTDKQMAVVDKIEKEVHEMGEMQKELKALKKKGSSRVSSYEIPYGKEAGKLFEVVGNGEMLLISLSRRTGKGGPTAHLKKGDVLKLERWKEQTWGPAEPVFRVMEGKDKGAEGTFWPSGFDGGKGRIGQTSPKKGFVRPFNSKNRVQPELDLQPPKKPRPPKKGEYLIDFLDTPPSLPGLGTVGSAFEVMKPTKLIGYSSGNLYKGDIILMYWWKGADGEHDTKNMIGAIPIFEKMGDTDDQEEVGTAGEDWGITGAIDRKDSFLIDGGWWHPKKGVLRPYRGLTKRYLEEFRGGKKAFRVASLGDLTDFLKTAEGKLIHKSTNDLWSYAKDADGNFLVSRLFDDEGEPLKG